jgi:hypothetical protein
VELEKLGIDELQFRLAAIEQLFDAIDRLGGRLTQEQRDRLGAAAERRRRRREARARSVDA